MKEKTMKRILLMGPPAFAIAMAIIGFGIIFLNFLPRQQPKIGTSYYIPTDDPFKPVNSYPLFKVLDVKEDVSGKLWYLFSYYDNNGKLKEEKISKRTMSWSYTYKEFKEEEK